MTQPSGNHAPFHEDVPTGRARRWLDDLVQDLRYTARSLAGHKTFAVSVFVTLALGIGATTAVFSVVNGLVLRPLPFPEPDRLVRLFGTSATESRAPVQTFRAYADRAASFEAVSGAEIAAAFLRDGASADRLMTVRTAGDFFGVLGVAPLRGRTFTPADGPSIAVASEGLWRRRFNADPALVGATLVIDNRSVTVVGIMPDTFQYPYGAASIFEGIARETRTDLWLPFEGEIGPRSRLGNVTARLKPGVSLAAAQADLDRVSAALQAEFPETNGGRRVVVDALDQVVVAGPARRVIFLLFGAVGLLMALSCANVLNLSLGRMSLRAREVAVRTALGASRRRLLRQFLTESLALTAAGGLGGLAIAGWGTRELVWRAAVQIPRAHELTIDWRVFLFLAAVCVTTAVVIGIMPALVAGRRDLHAMAGRGTTNRAQRYLRDALVVGEVAVACLLAVGGAMLGRELLRMHATDPGMATENVLTLHVGGRRTADIDPTEFYAIADRVAQVPGVEAAGFTQLLPLQNWGWTSSSADFLVKGRPPVSPPFPIHMRYVTPGYFEALRIPILRGRNFTAADTAKALAVVLVNETLARRQFGNDDPIGQTTNRGTIVGVIRDFRQAHLDRTPVPELYFPIAQNWSQVSDLGMTLVVSTAGAPEAFVDRIRAAVADASPRHVIFNVRTMDQVVAESLSTFTLDLAFMAAFAGLALVLALSGTYGVIAYLAGARRKEFAIRMALGADGRRVASLVLRRGAALTVAGVALGLGAAMTLAPLVTGLPVSIRPPDLVTTVPVAAFLVVVALAASLVPAVRSARVNPTEALRSD